MLICTLIVVILLHSKHFQTPKNSLDVNTLAGCKFTFWQLTLVDRPIWNLDLKYFTNEDDILYINCSDH